MDFDPAAGFVLLFTLFLFIWAEFGDLQVDEIHSPIRMCETAAQLNCLRGGLLATDPRRCVVLGDFRRLHAEIAICEWQRDFVTTPSV